VTTEFDKVLVRRLSAPRLTSYFNVTENDLSHALRLYEWNVLVSGAFFELLSDVEVVIRNSFDEQLTQWHLQSGRPGHWYDNEHGFLMPRATDAIATARKRITDKGKRESSNQIVSELGFGFWRFLLTKPYKTNLWPFAGQYAFPNVASTAVESFYARVARLHDFRNRIAHHEPIHTRKLHLDLRDCFSAIGAVCADTEIWVQARSRVEGLLATRPA
jgi:hypothetical protein